MKKILLLSLFIFSTQSFAVNENASDNAADIAKLVTELATLKKSIKEHEDTSRASFTNLMEGVINDNHNQSQKNKTHINIINDNTLPDIQTNLDFYKSLLLINPNHLYEKNDDNSARLSNWFFGENVVIDGVTYTEFIFRTYKKKDPSTFFQTILYFLEIPQ